MANNKTRLIIAGFVLVTCIALIAYANTHDSSKIVKEFSVESTGLMPGDGYRSLVSKALTDVQLQKADEIRNYILHQPYVQACEAAFTAPGKLLLRIQEKEIAGRVFASGKSYLLSTAGEMIELQEGTAALDLPVFSGISYKDKVFSLEDRDRIAASLTILAAFTRVDPAISKDISEIVWLKSDQPALFLRDYASPFLVTVKSAAKQAVYLQALLNEKQAYQNMLASAAYVDMRYDKHIFIGNENNPGKE